MVGSDVAMLFRCRICGDPYIGTQPPSRCPFCGAAERFIIDAHDWNPAEFDVQLSDLSRANLLSALQLELDNTSFYACAAKSAGQAGDGYMEAKFKALRKIEAEHAAAACKFLKQSVPALAEATCSSDSAANSQEGHQRETRAVAAYSKFKDDAVEPRIQEFFGALVEIESDHLEIHSKR